MFRYIFNKILLSIHKRYHYDVSYMQDILNTEVSTFLKFIAFQTMSSHSRHVPAGPLYAAKLRSILQEDCGPCTQLIANMALEEKLTASTIRAIIECDLSSLPDDIALVAEFTDKIIHHDPEADKLRKRIINLWGMNGLITIAYSISSTRVYPTLKYALGYGKSCHRINVEDAYVVPHYRRNQQ